MTDAIGFGTAFQNPDEDNAWEGAEAIGTSEEQVLDAIRQVVQQYGLTQDEFDSQDPLYLTEVRKVRQITWDDVK